ncbi:efflux RND transporter periplasmic adaptor subunit [Mangrovimonas sp. YM274]|uniref:efflux RND transporter periplasmic adaptor subunit n=1 Tax=Mangrovimonas sp. YM274 TaxID=3070660 RepID=UPI0027DDCA2B|nr:efflux RND transporter periplasmic adaptor subunit [Mangrovimonas sp. YM274]WMI67760.1 efflux RND transporter periplasmic adaptor subunit [Mangrovimonas sp. YM274]
MKTKFTYILYTTAFLVLASCNSNKNQTVEEETVPDIGNDTIQLSKVQFESSNMVLGTLQSLPFQQYVKTMGMIDVPPENKASISSYFEGTVKNLKLLPGEYVKRNQTLFTLENPEYVQIQQEYLEAKGQLTYLKSDYERQKTLAKEKVTSQKTFLKAESDYLVTKARFESIGKKLLLMNINPATLSLDNIRTTIAITSPIDGYVTNVNISTGAYLNPTEVAATVVNTEHLHLELNVFEKDLQKIQIGQPILFKIQNDNEAIYNAKVHIINKAVDPEKRTIGIHGHLSEEAEKIGLAPGMYAEASIVTNSVSKQALPSEAIVEMDGKNMVLVLQEKTDSGFSFLQKEVLLGDTHDNQTEILNVQDFNGNTQFLVRGAFNLITE